MRHKIGAPVLSLWYTPSFTITVGTVPAPSSTKTTPRFFPFAVIFKMSSLMDKSGISSEIPPRDLDLDKSISCFIII